MDEAKLYSYLTQGPRHQLGSSPSPGLPYLVEVLPGCFFVRLHMGDKGRVKGVVGAVVGIPPNN
jgi:hypothetical protein